jgi:hypothetical protein
MATRDGKLKLHLIDVYGNLLGEKVDINLRNQGLSDEKNLSVSAAKDILITGLYGPPQGLYRIEIDPPSYLPMSQFVNLSTDNATELEIAFPIDPKKVKRVNFPKFDKLPGDLQIFLENSDSVLSFPEKKGAALYDSLDAVRKAGLLNIFKKSANTLLSNGQTVFSHFAKLLELRGDRFFAIAPKELREETKNSIAYDQFYEVSELLHHPPVGYNGAGSYKTHDKYGNLQLSFFMKENECVVDVDIDDAGGLEHIFQVLRNTFTGRPTHPYDIHEILVEYQKLDPGYAFVV